MGARGYKRELDAFRGSVLQLRRRTCLQEEEEEKNPKKVEEQRKKGTHLILTTSTLCKCARILL